MSVRETSMLLKRHETLMLLMREKVARTAISLAEAREQLRLSIIDAANEEVRANDAEKENERLLLIEQHVRAFIMNPELIGELLKRLGYVEQD